MAQLKIERDHPGTTARYWLEDGVVVVQLGRDLNELEQRRVIRDAMREYGIRRRRRFLPIPLVPPQLRDVARDHPTTTVAVTGLLATGVAAGAMFGAGLPGDEPRPRRKRPPAVADPSPTRGPSTAMPSEPSTGASPSPGHRDAPARPTTTPTRARPTPVRPSPTPTGSRPPPPTTRPSTAPPPPPGPGEARCLLHLTALGLIDVQLLCAR